ncbi:DNA cytosine methyltransferase [Eubacterium sp.]
MEQLSFLTKEKSTDWRWSMKKDYPPKNGLKVFSCFACGGGSTMGYKLAGCEVLGCCEIDKKMNQIYVANHKPKYNFLMDIREFNKLENIPDELYNLDILDGSPPCTTFSMAGEREDSWGKKKKFREGQAEQTLDDLSFVFIETVKKLKPKCVIMENVEGLLLGDAWKYVQKIYKHFNEAGYDVKHYLLKGEDMGIPQKRHRVFFIAVKKEFDFDFYDLDLSFNYEPVTYGEIKEGKTTPLKTDSKFRLIAEKAINSDKSIADTRIRLGEKGSAFQTAYIRETEIMPTQRAASADVIDIKEIGYVSNEVIRSAQTFPTDYDFINNSRSNVGYICGMSVPPLMIKRIVNRLLETNLFK